jgi:hypothetical protein
MKSMHIAALEAATVALALFSGAATAGRSCDAAKPPPPQMIEKGMNLAERTMKALDAEHAKNGTKVVVLARAGQDLSKYGLRYSHLGFAYKTPEGPWLVAHKLNTCGTAEASLYRQGLGEFFLDDLFRYEAAWSVPTREVQDKLYATLTDKDRSTAMHTKPYSMVSYAWALKYQQSNQWALETLAAAMEGSIRNRQQAQAWLQFKGYEPTTLKIGPLTRLGGRVTAANVAFDDHPNEKRFSDRIETATVDSVFAWLQRANLAAAPVTLIYSAK